VASLFLRSISISASQSLSPIPSNHRSALKDSNWLNAMQDEYNALMNHNTWTLVPRPVGANVMMGKWIFRHKFNTDGSLATYKASWVVRDSLNNKVLIMKRHPILSLNWLLFRLFSILPSPRIGLFINSMSRMLSCTVISPRLSMRTNRLTLFLLPILASFAS
jgi:hypothetical protein